MFSKLHDRLGTAGFVVAIVALVAALAGTAYAAAKLNSTQKKEVAKIAKKFAKAGPQGPAGPAGAKGDTGSQGPKGDTGSAGKDGTNGSNGKNVETGTATVAECPQGGATVQVAGEAATKKKICNGLSGFTETLPSGKMEKGTWVFGPYAELEKFPGKNAPVKLPISFPIPLATAPTPHLILSNGKELDGTFTEVENPPACPGSVANPTAEAGNFCLYAKTSNLTAPSNSFEGELLVNPGSAFVDPGTNSSGVSTVGLILEAFTKEVNGAQAFGTWAVSQE